MNSVAVKRAKQTILESRELHECLCFVNSLPYGREDAMLINFFSITWSFGTGSTVSQASQTFHVQHFSCPPQRDKCSQDTPQYCSHHHHRRPIASHCGLKTNLVVNMESNKTTSCLWGKSQCNWLSHNAHDQSSQLQPSRHGTWSKLAIQVTIDWTQQWRLM